MPVTFDTAAGRSDYLSGFSSSGSKTLTVTTNSGATDVVAFVGLAAYTDVNTTGASWTVTWGGVAMTLVDDPVFWSSNKETARWYMLENPPLGTQTVSYSFTGMPTQFFNKAVLMTAGAWSGVESVGTPVSAGGSSATSAAVTVPSVLPAHKVISFHAHGPGISTSTYSPSLRASTTLNNGGRLFLGDSPGATSVVASMAQESTTRWAAFGVSLAPAVVDFSAELTVNLSVESAAGTYRTADPAPDRTWVIDGGWIDGAAQNLRTGPKGDGIDDWTLDDETGELAFFYLGEPVGTPKTLPVSPTAAWSSITGKPSTFAPTIGSTSSTAVAGDDARLTDERVPVDESVTSAKLDSALAAQIAGFESSANKGEPDGYAPLDGSGLVPSAHLPSYVDDVVDVANYAALPGTGESGKIYITIDTGRQYRWSGSAYAEILASPGTTDAITEGSTKLFFTDARARTAAVADTITDGVTNIAPSQNAVSDALALKANASVQVIAGTGLTGGGTLAADRTLTVAYGTSGSTACVGNDSRLSDARTPVAHAHTPADITGFPYDIYYMQSAGTRALGLGGNAMGVKLQRACTLTSVTYRCGTADASGNLTVELRKNGVAVSGSSATVAAGSQVTGGTSTGSWAFSAGDILTVYVTAVGTTPGSGLVADITAVL